VQQKLIIFEKKSMKRSFSILLLIVMLFVTSCQTRVVSSQQPLRDNTLELYKKYSIQTSDAQNVKVQVLKVDENKVYGKLKDGQHIEINRTDIREVKKTDLVASLAIGAAAILALIFIPV